MAGFLSEDQFKSLSDESRERKKNESTIPWRDVPLNTIYKVVSTKEVPTANSFGDTPSVVVTLTDEHGETIKAWATGLLSDDIRENKAAGKTKLFIKSLGKKTGKKPGRFSYEYDLVAKD